MARLTSPLRWVPILAVALYLAVPIICSIAFATFPGGSFSLRAFEVLTGDQNLASAALRTLTIAAITIVVLLLTLVPAVVAVHLWAPRLRPLLEVLCTLPLVVPSIALAAGVISLLRWGASQGRGSVPGQISQTLQNPDLPLILVGTYVVLCLPFTFRSIDAGLRTIPLKAIVEGSTILGASTWGTIWRVVLPNIAGPVRFSAFFGTALCFGEFSIAATLSQQTVPVWLFTVSQTDFRASIAVAVLLNLTTWALMLLATVAASRMAPTRVIDDSNTADPAQSASPEKVTAS
ncbi:ABC transporter permease [Microbacterium amylolyticum]|uniref:Spermidine/putrescine transport system permease protein n=1 Tax=Microbacterium amylolyticum TaxID=936337 RepID=A0ABS4ZDQ8_9MICO|nr:ABC transporter permease subunit [Microbacterium amylolyticum]MBP2435419.1 putative spermidine/putrescine transport system permease protein [Microbacterium amylolyticum]